jgi:hypothetical protein
MLEENMRDILYVMALVWTAMSVVVLLTMPPEPPPVDAACLERGHSKHKAAGHWPYLGDGRLAAAEVARHCSHTHLAYGR